MGTVILQAILSLGCITVLILLYAAKKNPVAYRKKIARPARMYATTILLMSVLYVGSFREGLQKGKEITEEYLIQRVRSMPDDMFVFKEAAVLTDTAKGYALAQKRATQKNLQNEIYEANRPIFEKTEKSQRNIFFSGLAIIILIDFIKWFAGYLVKKNYPENPAGIE